MSDDFAPPVSIEAEQALLGAVLMNPNAFYAVADHAEAECFSEPLHAKLWEIITFRMESGRVPYDPVTLPISLGPDAESMIGEITVRQYIARLASSAVSIISAPDYAKTIRALWKRRRLMALGQQIAYRAQGGDEDGDVDELIEEADTELHGIRFGTKSPGIVRIDEAVCNAIDLTARAYQQGKELGIDSSVPDIASLLGPLMAGDLITLLAQSGNGKTAVAAQYIMDAVRPPESNREPAPSLMFSQEMMAVQIARRAIAYESGIATWKQRQGSIDVSEFDMLITAARGFKDLPIYIDQTANQKVSAIVRKARQMKKLYGIKFVVVDHLLEIRAEHAKQTEFDVIANAALELKTLAKEQDVTVLLLAQCTRESQKRDHWGVRTQDLYGGERVRQRSDIMFSLAIPGVWMRDREPKMGSEEHFKWQAQMEQWHGKAEIGVLKMRDGENGGKRLVAFDGARMRFSQLDDAQLLPRRTAAE